VMYKTVDLFSGAGGLSYGFEATGKFSVIAAAEINKYARETFVYNHKNNKKILMITDVKEYDFRRLNEDFNGIDVVVGGPPCQGFSNANRQKNHIISMNNSLVKEYFRAIREISPKAFVMENVSMLSSSKHKFYDSKLDHDVICELHIEMQDENITLLDSRYEDIDILNVFNQSAEKFYSISDELFSLLNRLYKNWSKPDKVLKFLDKNKKKILILMKQWLEVGGKEFSIINDLKKYFNGQEDVLSARKLKDFVSFQKCFRLKKELDDNQIIYSISQLSSTGEVVARVKSYTVIDYVKSILGSSYRTVYGEVNALDFGVPQERKRFIMIGINSEIAIDKSLELPTGVRNIITVDDAIMDLARYPVEEDIELPRTLSYLDDDNLSSFAKRMRENSDGVSNHIVPKTREKAKERFEALKEGENFHKLSAELKDNYSDPKRTQNSIYLRLNRNEPSGTVINVRKSMWIHPTIDRAVSVREAARLQSFPDAFVFKGTKDSQYQQVGNAVPPLMAEGIANTVLKYLEEEKAR